MASELRLSLGVVAVFGASLLTLNLMRVQTFEPARLAREISWPILAFIAGMLLVVQGLHNEGVTAALGHGLTDVMGSSDLSAIAISTAGSAVGSNLINNLPMALIMVSTVHTLHVSDALRHDVIYGTILGCDLGPNLTHLGSLATFLRLFFLHRKGLDVSTWDYFRIGIIVTPLMLLAGTLGLWLTVRGL